MIMNGKKESSMRALLKDKPDQGYKLTTMDVPEPKEDELLIRVEKVGICGSDIALYTWNEVARVIATVPFIPGHEATGVVVAKGPNANVEIGARVAVENHFYCGDCVTCHDGRGDICEIMNQYGHGRGTMHGGFSEFSLVPSKYCFVLNGLLSPTQAALLEPMGVAHNAVESIEVNNKDVLVVGTGPIGLLAIPIAKALGATRVVCASMSGNASKIELAKCMGADEIIDCSKVDLMEESKRLTNGIGFARLVEVSGSISVINTCFKLLHKGAQVVLVGLPKKAIHIEDPLPDIIFKSVTIKSVHGRRIFHTWRECERLVEEGKVRPELVVSHQFTLSQWQDAFDTLMARTACKILVDPQQ